jgi:hypothetical protein
MKTYIHYGSTAFIEESWEPIHNENWIKPHGGLWASAIDAPYGWDCDSILVMNKDILILVD